MSNCEWRHKACGQPVDMEEARLPFPSDIRFSASEDCLAIADEFVNRYSVPRNEVDENAPIVSARPLFGFAPAGLMRLRTDPFFIFFRVAERMP